MMIEFQMAAMRYPELREAYAEQYGAMVDRVDALLSRAMPDVPEKPTRRALAESLVALQPAIGPHRLLAPQRVPAATDERTISR